MALKLSLRQYIQSRSRAREQASPEVEGAWRKVNQIASQTHQRMTAVRQSFDQIVYADKALSAMLGSSHPDFQELLDLEHDVVRAINAIEIKLEAIERLSGRWR